MNRKDIERIKAYCQRATEGPWKRSFIRTKCLTANSAEDTTSTGDVCKFSAKGHLQDWFNYHFVSKARFDLPKLAEYCCELVEQIDSAAQRLAEAGIDNSDLQKVVQEFRTEFAAPVQEYAGAASEIAVAAAEMASLRDEISCVVTVDPQQETTGDLQTETIEDSGAVVEQDNTDVDVEAVEQTVEAAVENNESESTDQAEPEAQATDGFVSEEEMQALMQEPDEQAEDADQEAEQPETADSDEQSDNDTEQDIESAQDETAQADDEEDESEAVSEQEEQASSEEEGKLKAGEVDLADFDSTEASSQDESQLAETDAAEDIAEKPLEETDETMQTEDDSSEQSVISEIEKELAKTEKMLNGEDDTEEKMSNISEEYIKEELTEATETDTAETVADDKQAEEVIVGDDNQTDEAAADIEPSETQLNNAVEAAQTAAAVISGLDENKAGQIEQMHEAAVTASEIVKELDQELDVGYADTLLYELDTIQNLLGAPDTKDSPYRQTRLSGYRSRTESEKLLNSIEGIQNTPKGKLSEDITLEQISAIKEDLGNAGKDYNPAPGQKVDISPISPVTNSMLDAHAACKPGTVAQDIWLEELNNIEALLPISCRVHRGASAESIGKPDKNNMASLTNEGMLGEYESQYTPRAKKALENISAGSKSRTSTKKNNKKTPKKTAKKTTKKASTKKTAKKSSKSTKSKTKRK